MPELPEVETVVRGLAPRLPGHTLITTRVTRPDIVEGGTPAHLARTLKGRAFKSVERRAKNIVISLEGDIRLVVNLGMTGRLLFFGPGRRIRETHVAVRWRLSDGARLAYDDVRRFGRVWAGPAHEWEARARAIGPEPLDPDYTPEQLFAGLQSSRSPMRSWLLDQRKIAGVGNIYANEALFLAGVRPSRPARDVSFAEATALHRGLRSVLERAIRSGGTTLRDYRNADGEPGEFGSALAVYGREGLECGTCDAVVERSVFGGRSAFHCPGCQA